MTYYQKISEDFFKKEWSNYEGSWDFRELLRYLSDRNIDISIDKWSLWIQTDKDTIEIMLYHPMSHEEQEWECKKLYEAFCRWDKITQETLSEIKTLLS